MVYPNIMDIILCLNSKTPNIGQIYISCLVDTYGQFPDYSRFQDHATSLLSAPDLQHHVPAPKHLPSTFKLSNQYGWLIWLYFIHRLYHCMVTTKSLQLVKYCRFDRGWKCTSLCKVFVWCDHRISNKMVYFGTSILRMDCRRFTWDKGWCRGMSCIAGRNNLAQCFELINAVSTVIYFDAAPYPSTWNIKWEIEGIWNSRVKETKLWKTVYGNTLELLCVTLTCVLPGNILFVLCQAEFCLSREYALWIVWLLKVYTMGFEIMC